MRGPLWLDVSGGHLQASGVSPLSFAYFSLRPAKKSRCRPAQGQRRQTKKNARKGQPPKNNDQNQGAAGNLRGGEGQKSNSPAHLPKAIKSHSIEHNLVLTDSARAMNADTRIRIPTPLKHRRQILPHMPTLPEENGNNSDARTPKRNLRSNSRREIRLHQLKKRQRDRPGGAIRLPQLSREPLKRLPPARIPSPMSK